MLPVFKAHEDYQHGADEYHGSGGELRVEERRVNWEILDAWRDAAEECGIPKIDDGPWPAFPPDLTSIAVVLATQARGTILIHEKMFESRLFWVDRLIAMGARIVLGDPHTGVRNLQTKSTIVQIGHADGNRFGYPPGPGPGHRAGTGGVLR